MSQSCDLDMVIGLCGDVGLVEGRPGRAGPQCWLVTADVCSDGGSLDGLGGILFADKDLQEAELGLDPLVLPVLVQHRHPVLLLNISTREG